MCATLVSSEKKPCTSRKHVFEDWLHIDGVDALSVVSGENEAVSRGRWKHPLGRCLL